MLAAALVLLSAAEADPSIHLACYGGGTSRRPTMAHGQVYGGGDSASATVTGTRLEGFEDHVRVEITGDSGRIRVPRAIMPPLRGGGDDGWWRLKNIELTEDEITAKFTLNFINNPRVRIDRLTGQIEIDGKNGRFSGVCEPFDPEKVQRRF